MSISFTMTVVVPNNRHPFVFMKVFDTLDHAIIWARGEIRQRDAEFILIREGQYATDPVVWDSRTQGPAVVYQEDLLEADMKRAQEELGHLDPGLQPIWTHTQVPAGFPLRAMNEYFEKRAASILGDHDSKVDFSTWQPHEKEGFRDYRYKSVAVRMAWMMYLDLAVQWHKSKQLDIWSDIVKQINEVQRG